MLFPCVCLLQSGEWRSRFGLSRVSGEQGTPRGPELPGLAGVVPPRSPSPVPKLLLPQPASLVAKEIQLMHRAPVVGILVLDGHSVPLPEPLEVAHDLSKSPDMQGSHQLLVVSEEQFKVPRGRVPGCP